RHAKRMLGRPSPARGGHLQNFPRDDHALDFAGALADGAELDVAVELLRWVILDEPIPTVELHGLVADADGDFAGVELGHAGFAGDALACVLEHGGAL